MPKPHVCFLVHGMGSHKATWSETGQKILSSHYEKSFSESPDDTLGSHVDFVEIQYNDIFNDVRERWKEEQKQFAQHLEGLAFTDTPLAKVNEAMGWLADSTDFGATHLLDVFLYRYTVVGRKIRVAIAKKIIPEIRQRYADTTSTTSWSIIGHSLGTTVTHDTLQAMFSHDFTDDEGNVLHLTDSMKPRAVIMIANVTGILRTPSFDPYNSKVKPMRSTVHSDNTAYCQKYLNINHKLDPLTLVKKFTPKSWLNEDRDYIEIDRLEGVTDLNVHDLEHYLKNPLCSAAIIRRMTNRSRNVDKFQEALADYQSESLTQVDIQDLKKQLQRLKESDIFDGIEEERQVMTDLLSASKDFSSKLVGLYDDVSQDL